MVNKKIDNKNMEYIDDDLDYKKRIRTEIIFTPLLIFVPLIIGILLINDWFIRDIIRGEIDLFGELLLGLLIITVNIIFDIPFIRNLIRQIKEKK